jgi:hypothetical protein
MRLGLRFSVSKIEHVLRAIYPRMQELVLCSVQQYFSSMAFKSSLSEEVAVLRTC